LCLPKGLDFDFLAITTHKCQGSVRYGIEVFKIFKYYKSLSTMLVIFGDAELALYLLLEEKKSVLRTENTRNIVKGPANWGYSKPSSSRLW